MTKPEQATSRKQKAHLGPSAPSSLRPDPAPNLDPSQKETFGARVSRRAADRLRAGHVWVYASDFELLSSGNAPADQPPSLVPVADYRGMLLGTALYCPSSQIPLRMVSRDATCEAEWLKLLVKRLSHAIDRRVPMMNSD